MKKWICLALIMALLPAYALASPEPDQFHCTLTLTLESTGTLQDPFDRWAREMIALIQPEIHIASWPEGQALLLDVWTGNLFAFSIELLAEGDKVAIQSSIGDGDWVVLPPDAAKEALALIAQIREVLAPGVDWPQADSTLTLHSGRAQSQMRLCAAVLRRWAEVADDPNKDYTLAIATALSGFADFIARDAPGTPLIKAFVDYQPPSLAPGQIQRDWPEGDASIAADVVSQIPGEVLRTIAGLE